MGPRTVTRDQLKSVPLFSACRRIDLGYINSLLRDRSVAAGTVLTKEGTPGNEFIIVLEGGATVRRRGRKVANFGPGDFFGEIALIDHGPRTATVIADTPMKLKVLGRAEWYDLLGQPGLAGKMLEALAARIRALEPTGVQ